MSEPGSNSNLKTALGGGALLALLASNIYLFVQLHDIKAASVKQQDAFAAQIQDLKDNTTNIAATTRKQYREVAEDVDRKSREAVRAASSVKTETLSKVEQTRKQLEEEQAQTAEKLNTDLSTVKDNANAKIAEVSTDVGTVKTQVVSTQDELHKAVSQLQKVQGDLGQTSSYVAKNSTDLAALRRLGERNYIEFNISKSKEPQKVGDIQVLLRKTDPKKSKFTLTVMADDKSIEKKDRTANEPVQFYVNKARQPYEIVVNTVRKDQISGYLATPKDTIPR